MNPIPINRRQFFDSVQNGLYGAALASLLTRDLYGKEPHHKPALPMDTRPRQPHFAPRARLDETAAARKPVLAWEG